MFVCCVLIWSPGFEGDEGWGDGEGEEMLQEEGFAEGGEEGGEGVEGGDCNDFADDAGH